MRSFGLITRREVWVPTWRGWFLMLGAGLFLLVGAAVTTVPFLAVSRPVHRGVLVVEGWVPDYTLEEAKRVFESHSYQWIVVTGVPIDQGLHISAKTNYAQLAAATLKKLGVKEEAIIALSSPKVHRNRTYAMALKVRDWLDSRPAPEPLDVLTLGVHARRSWLLYRLALGERYAPGVVASADRRYDPNRWWATSSGFRTVTSELIAFAYAKFLFYPRLSGAAEVAAE